jgi:FHA domain
MEALAVVEILGRNGEILRRERLFSLPALIGRGFEADLMFDDPYIAASHLRLDAHEDNGFTLTDLGTINGFSIPARSNLRQGTTVHIEAGETIRLGHTQIRIWRSDSPVVPEVLDRSPSDTRGWITFVAWLLVAPGLMALLMWVGATGPGRYGAVSLEFLSWAAAVLIWSGLWWVASRSSHHITTYIAHGSVGASTLAIIFLGLFTLDTIFFVYDLSESSHRVFSGAVLGACLALGLYRHLRLVSRKSKQMVLSVSVAVAFALIVPLYYTLEQNDLDKIGLMDIPSQLRLPWMRIAHGVLPEEFLN